MCSYSVYMYVADELVSHFNFFDTLILVLIRVHLYKRCITALSATCILWWQLTDPQCLMAHVHVHACNLHVLVASSQTTLMTLNIFIEHQLSSLVGSLSLSKFRWPAGYWLYVYTVYVYCTCTRLTTTALANRLLILQCNIDIHVHKATDVQCMYMYMYMYLLQPSIPFSWCIWNQLSNINTRITILHMGVVYSSSNTNTKPTSVTLKTWESINNSYYQHYACTLYMYILCTYPL